MTTYTRNGIPVGQGRHYHWSHCKQGHPLESPDSYYEDTRGHRRCRRCTREKAASYYHQKKSAADGATFRSALTPHRYRGWAAAAWRRMSHADRALVSLALTELDLDLEEAA